jgi:hypothetical protein
VFGCTDLYEFFQLLNVDIVMYWCYLMLFVKSVRDIKLALQE